MPIRRLALLPFAVMAVGLSACTITTGGTDEPSGDPTEEATSESAATTETTPASTDDTGLEVEAETVATAAEDALEPVIGSRPDIDCGELTLTVFVDRQTYCTLTDPANGDEYEVTLMVTSIEGESFQFDVEVADTPK